MTVTQQLNAKYAEGKVAVIRTNWKNIVIKNRNDIKAVKGGIKFRRGLSGWVFAFHHQVQFGKYL